MANFFIIKYILAVALFLVVNLAAAQDRSAITDIDFVKITDSHRQEALYYYENNWKIFRDIALKKGVIKSYKILSA